MNVSKPLRYRAKKDDVIAFFGGVNATARAFNVSSGAVAQWGEIIPEIRARQLDEVTNGKLKPVIDKSA